jgi:hypothetical protein
MQGCHPVFLVSCCFLGSRDLLRESAQFPEGYLTQWNQIRDALPLERSWLDLTVVDPRSNLCYFNHGGSRQDNNKRASPNRILMGGHLKFFFLTQTLSFVFVCCCCCFNRVELPWQQYIISMYVQENMLFLKKLKLPSLSIKGHVWSQ